jgi:protein subunit release factor A
MIFKKLSAAEDRYREIEQMLTLPEVVSDNKEYSKLIAEGALEEDFYKIKNKGSRKFLLQLPL